ncbi:helix-turn-helix domain-containing protein [Subsaximicrobium wynnwilliamsii]|uniref:Helix-turn-helix domain-containing protein n=1 Tax=Subsaximicrobium wynnwilliamsii TaxID=291179 RepID=A0A5C6ZJK0_9FLAO|nr:XRE family transcriptional regulator [Subsaximicrobium wynnwilliamsii]TXD84807.1 helix-turn-helix domain-containing protein [Subsaximicrobium wynnwilliamsii]TXD90478.1 helix-turn-helix domain-containing protein [Subsaximicrobium wynnwilliamsii]TXE04953.1 helix-turn-helix domain-containing protein [Subsaximicrobium wynnwilliamsii]
MEEDYIKLIFGLKLKQIRTDRNLSLFGLSKLSGLSKSYLNEIENGKKYPKPDKIAILSEKLDVPYDQMVSLKLDKNLAPIGDLLQSKVLKEIPLELFGIKERNLIDIVANAPAKVNAFISTIIEIAQNYNFSRESFYLASVRSFQEANNNYFEDLEQSVLKFAKAYQIDLNQIIASKDLEEILIEEYGYVIEKEELVKYKALGSLRSVFVPKSKTLLLTNEVDEAQRTFIYAKELAYNFLEIKERLFTFPWIKFDTFDQVLNNFYASYFAGALIIPTVQIKEQLNDIFKKETFDRSLFLKAIETFNASPESFYQRLTNILPQAFNIQNLFFLRFTHKANSDKFHLKKELHLSHQHSPHANETNEHYCRRWVSLKVLKDISKSKNEHEFDLQISDYEHDGMKYLIMSSATKDPFKENQYRSISVGLLINRQLQRKLNFLEDKTIVTQKVGVTCQRCAIKNCDVRQAPAVVLDEAAKNKKIERVVEELNSKFG